MKTIRAKIGLQKFKTEIQAANHIIIADEPIEVGGQHLGLSPTQLLEASLASCTAMTLRIYADRKGWELKEAIVTIGYKRNITTREVTFVKEIELIGNLDESQRQKLLDIGAKCPVEKMITGNISVNSSLKS